MVDVEVMAESVHLSAVRVPFEIVDQRIGRQAFAPRPYRRIRCSPSAGQQVTQHGLQNAHKANLRRIAPWHFGHRSIGRTKFGYGSCMLDTSAGRTAEFPE